MKKLNHFIIFTMIMIISISLFTACGKNEENTVKKDSTITKNETNNLKDESKTNTSKDVNTNKTDINIAALKGPTAIGMVQIMQNNEMKQATNHYNFSLYGTADEITAKLIKGEIDVAAIPCNLASVLYNKTKGEIEVAAINTLGVLYIVENGDTIHSVEDLAGKTIYSTGKGTTPEYTLNYLLRSYGIDPLKDVTIEYKSESTEVASLLSTKDNAIALLPQPYVTTVMMNNDNVRIALDVTKEWDKKSKDASTIVTGVVVARKDFINNNKAAFDSFLEEYNESTTYVNEYVDEAANLVEKFDIFKAVVAKDAIPDCNITFISGLDMKTNITGYLKTLYDQNPQSVGGSMPTEDFYYIQK